MKSATEMSLWNLKGATGMTMSAALKLSGFEFSERDASAEMVASLALKMFPDVTPRDLVALGIGASSAVSVITDGMDGMDGMAGGSDFEVFASMVNSLRATIDSVEDKYGVSLSGGATKRLCAGRGE